MGIPGTQNKTDDLDLDSGPSVQDDIAFSVLDPDTARGVACLLPAIWVHSLHCAIRILSPL